MLTSGLLTCGSGNRKLHMNFGINVRYLQENLSGILVGIILNL